ncbi:MAG: metallopeptidase family protein [Caldilineaceae bacterium]|nr:metallopeptidase family protein [Caldilineaceae bacterium]MCY4090542.1 metallopeptidase family protein [Caldilineaceae bacterium]MCY4117769.1 metallopeptidase family protein [Caldilineaceae bacterium]MDE0071422.1 metallopeptidase family protein [Caldilineaceae bacterium]MDE0183647.1 metallopeptidase family protein [Caldilineaceae bacterium]
MKPYAQPEQFDELVLSAIEDLPDELLDFLENVAIVVEEWPDRAVLDSVGVRKRSELLGLYQGIPQTERTHGYNLVMPDKISIYRRPILMRCRSEQDVFEMVQRVVRHEIAHHFGIDDDRLTEIGAY